MLRIFFFLLLTTLIACNTNEPADKTINKQAGFSLLTDDNAELTYENLRLIPVKADADFIEAQSSLSGLKNLAEGMKIDRFRITEKKPYGSRDDRDAVNTLTVQNKSIDTIFLMEGDIVQGGRQDRILAQDMVVPPRTLRDISVFCVEHGRWAYKNAESETPIAMTGETAKQYRKIQAFTGYYNVASSQVRRVVQKTNNQQAVWNEVNEVRSTFNVTSPTQAYTGLESSPDYTRERDGYLDFFKEKFADSEDIIGVVAVSNGKILGTDIFGHPALFKKQYKALIHSYTAEAMAAEKSSTSLSAKALTLYEKQLLHNFVKSNEGRFVWEGKTVHFTAL